MKFDMCFLCQCDVTDVYLDNQTVLFFYIVILEFVIFI